MSDQSDAEWLDGLNLTPEARELAERATVRHHGVNLERVQRIHLGLDSEEMEFSNVTLAAMLADVAERCDDADAFTLYGFVSALLGNDRHHILTLKRTRKGKFVSPHERELTHNRNQKWLWWLAHLESKGMKTEAAVMTIAEAEKVSRATVFGGIREAEHWLETGQTLFPKSENFENPRLAKSGKG